jgi:hypothetical protein
MYFVNRCPDIGVLKCEEIEGHRTLESEVIVWYAEEIKE